MKQQQTYKVLLVKAGMIRVNLAIDTLAGRTIATTGLSARLTIASWQRRD